MKRRKHAIRLLMGLSAGFLAVTALAWVFIPHATQLIQTFQILSGIYLAVGLHAQALSYDDEGERD